MSESTDAMIVVEHLVRRYDTAVALDDVSLSIAAGEIWGLLGPNGAGKSTALKILAGLVQPTGGIATVFGFDVVRHPLEAKALIGYVPETAPLYDSLTGREFLQLVSALHDLDDAAEPWCEEVITALGIGSWIDQRIAGVSKGSRQRLVLASALLHRPRLLLLDEPFDGLDVRGSEALGTLLTTLAAEGTAVLLTSHSIATVEALCGRVAILNRGRLVAAGAVGHVVGMYGAADLTGAFKHAISVGSGVPL